MPKKLLIFVTAFLIAFPVYAQTNIAPTITDVLLNGNTFKVGDSVSVSWTKHGDFPSQDSYFVYLKNRSDQVLGSHSSIQAIHYATIAFWQSPLSYPTFTFPVPFVTPGTYYLEIDFVDPDGMLITTATSKSFSVNGASVTIDLPSASSAQLSDAEVTEVRTLLMKLIQQLTLILQQSR